MRLTSSCMNELESVRLFCDKNNLVKYNRRMILAFFFAKSISKIMVQIHFEKWDSGDFHRFDIDCIFFAN